MSLSVVTGAPFAPWVGSILPASTEILLDKTLCLTYIYKLVDPYLQFWYRFVFPNLSLLEVDRIDAVYHVIQGQFSQCVAGVWEKLARRSCANLDIAESVWHPGARWWGKGRNGREMESDVNAEFLDHNRLLVGEVKWQDQLKSEEIVFTLRQNIDNLPLRKPYERVELAIWSKHPVESPACSVSTPAELCGALS